MICNGDRHTKRLTPRITIQCTFLVVVVTLRRSLLGNDDVHKIKKWTLPYLIRKIINLGVKQDTTYHLRDN